VRPSYDALDESLPWKAHRSREWEQLAVVSTDIRDACRAAASRFGTPLYLYDLDRLHADARSIATAFPDPWLRLYSLKANGLSRLVAEIAQEGFGASAVSAGELELAERAGLAPERVALEGIGKTQRELSAAAEAAQRGAPLLWVSLESADEAAALAATARRTGTRLDVLVRVNPQVQPETHGSLAVGAPESKFGVLASELPDVIEAGGGKRGPLRWRGIQLHVGSQLGAIDAWRSALRLGMRLLALQRASLPAFDTLDAGGGFPVAFGEPDSVPDVRVFGEAAALELDAVPADARPARLAIEPGRAVVAACGWIVAQVLHVRNRETTTVILDAGMSELIRPALYGSEHPFVPLTSLGRPIGTEGDADAPHPPPAMVRIEGPICESTDHLGSAPLPPLERGDLVAIGVAGAYASSMYSTYNGRPRPPEVGVDDGRLRLLRSRGSARTLP
jgi:diaminopimelate decarboxylase